MKFRLVRLTILLSFLFFTPLVAVAAGGPSPAWLVEVTTGTVVLVPEFDSDRKGGEIPVGVQASAYAGDRLLLRRPAAVVVYDGSKKVEYEVESGKAARVLTVPLPRPQGVPFAAVATALVDRSSLAEASGVMVRKAAGVPGFLAPRKGPLPNADFVAPLREVWVKIPKVTEEPLQVVLTCNNRIVDSVTLNPMAGIHRVAFKRGIPEDADQEDQYTLSLLRGNEFLDVLMLNHASEAVKLGFGVSKENVVRQMEAKEELGKPENVRDLLWYVALSAGIMPQNWDE